MSQKGLNYDKAPKIERAKYIISAFHEYSPANDDLKIPVWHKETFKCELQPASYF